MEDLNEKYINELKEKKVPTQNILSSTGDIIIDKKHKINMKKNIIKRRNIHNDFGSNLSYKKKLSCELDSLPTNINKIFRQSLDKYKFQMEVYVPHSMRISKKEYYNKNYMLNNLVKTQFKIEGEKNKIRKIAKETKKFSNQYKLVKNDNTNRQKEYLLNLENEYKKRKLKEINYKTDENIFTPSFLLDVNYGNNLDLDAYKYGQNNEFYLEESKKDKNLLQKFYDAIYRKDKKDKNQKIELDINNEQEDEIIRIKNELTEQIKIQNMTKKEYLKYSSQLKKEIKKIKNMLDEDYFIIDNDKNEIKNKKDLLENNETKYNCKSLEKNNLNNTSKGLRKEKSLKIINETNQVKESGKRAEKIMDNKNNIYENKKMGMTGFNNLKSKIPKLVFNKNDFRINEKKENKIDTKENKLTQLYNALSSRNNTEVPYKLMNQYFMKYSPKKLPKINVEKGSNIHGLVESAQNIINDNNIASFSKLNENLKKDIFRNNGKIRRNNDNKTVDTENIINIDTKILRLHYELADSLLSNKRDKFLKTSKQK